MPDDFDALVALATDLADADHKALRERRQRRESLGLTLHDMAIALGETVATIRLWETPDGEPTAADRRGLELILAARERGIHWA